MNAAPRVASTSAVVALVLATVWLFWPSALGGGTTYVTTHGISMEPGFHTGDLAILSPADSYSVGDVVAYRSESLDTIVMHRIVSMDGDGFVTQGDNNDWLDEDRPTEDEILGRLFFRIPQGGKALDALRSPAVLLPLAGVVVACSAPRPAGRGADAGSARCAVASPATSRSPTPRRRHCRPGRARRCRPALAPVRSRSAPAAVTLLAAVGCGVLLAAADHPDRDPHPAGRPSRASSPTPARPWPARTYPTGVIATGDTVWTQPRPRT